MKAAIYAKYGSPEVLEVADIPKPTPGPNEIVVQVHATTVTPVDIAFLRAKPWINRLFLGLRRPKNQVLGSNFAGEVESVGADVKSFAPGDRIFGETMSGTQAEYVCVQEDSPIIHMPEGISYQDAATFPYAFLTALPFLRDEGKIHPGQRLLIVGASGAIGSLAVQMAHLFGAKVTGVCSTKNVELVKRLGADTVIDYTQSDPSESGQKYDVIFDVVGKLPFGKARKVLTPSGKYLTAFFSWGIFPKMALNPFRAQKAKLVTTGLRKVAAKKSDLKLLVEMIEQGKLRPVIDHTYALTEIQDAYRYVETGHKVGNVIVTMV